MSIKMLLMKQFIMLYSNNRINIIQSIKNQKLMKFRITMLFLNMFMFNTMRYMSYQLINQPSSFIVSIPGMNNRLKLNVIFQLSNFKISLTLDSKKWFVHLEWSLQEQNNSQRKIYTLLQM